MLRGRHVFRLACGCSVNARPMDRRRLETSGRSRAGHAGSELQPRQSWTRSRNDIDDPLLTAGRALVESVGTVDDYAHKALDRQRRRI